MNIMKPDFELIALPLTAVRKPLPAHRFRMSKETLPMQKEKALQRLCAPMVLMLGY